MGICRGKVILFLGIACLCVSNCLSEYPLKKETVYSVGSSTDEDPHLRGAFSSWLFSPRWTNTGNNDEDAHLRGPFSSWFFNPRWTNTGKKYEDPVIHMFGEGDNNEQINLLLPTQGLDGEEVSSLVAPEPPLNPYFPSQPPPPTFPYLPPPIPPKPVPSFPPPYPFPPSPPTFPPSSSPPPSVTPPYPFPPSPPTFPPSLSPPPSVTPPYPFPPSPPTFPPSSSPPPSVTPPYPFPPSPPTFPPSSSPPPSVAPPIFPPLYPFPPSPPPSPSPSPAPTPSPSPAPSPSPTPIPPKISILTNLAVSNGAKLVPDFNPFVFNYKVSFGSNVRRFHVIAYLPDDEEDYKYTSLHIEFVPLKAGEKSPPLKLGKRGETLIYHIHVKAVNHDPSTYVLSVTREAGHKGIGTVATVFVVLACIVGAMILLVLGYAGYVYARTGRMLQLGDFQYSRERGSSVNTPLIA